MILQALNDYYRRLSENEDSGIAPPGYGPQKISFCLVLSPEGKLVQVEDCREPATKGKKKLPKTLLLPKEQKRAVNIAPNFLWDNSGYVLGVDGKGKPERSAKTFLAFRELHQEKLGALTDEGGRALLAFLNGWTPPSGLTDLPPVFLEPQEVVDSNLAFRLEGELGFIHQRPALQVLIKGESGSESEFTATLSPKPQASLLAEEESELKGEGVGVCLVTGQTAPIARLHPAIKGVRGAQSSGAALSSFNLQSFTSYGKTQNFNAPISQSVAEAYTTALNYLLRPESRQKASIGEVTFVFWSQAPSPVEGAMSYLLEFHSDLGLAEDLKFFFEALAKGKKPPGVDAENRFYLLGLSPNAARLSVRLWLESTVEAMAAHLGRYFTELELVKSFETDPTYPNFAQLLLETAPLHKFDNLSPLLEGALMRAVLTGARYPDSLLGSLIGRIRADRQVNYLRAALLKAVLIRNHQLEILMSLNPNSAEPGYNLGRLFAALEKAQRDAVNPKATIRDRFFGSASAAPGTVFPLLVRGAQNHLSKLAEKGIYLDKVIQEISQGLNGFPTHLSLVQQGQFVLGYYHQRQDFFTKKTTVSESTEQP